MHGKSNFLKSSKNGIGRYLPRYTKVYFTAGSSHVVTQENPRPPSILIKIDKPIVPHDRNMYAQF